MPLAPGVCDFSSVVRWSWWCVCVRAYAWWVSYCHMVGVILVGVMLSCLRRLCVPLRHMTSEQQRSTVC
jgi:hypothetical protein